MSITLDLPEGLVNELQEEAERLGLSLGDYVVRLLATGRESDALPTTGAELVAYWQRQGIIGSRSDISDSQIHACKIRNQAEHRSRD